MITQQQAEKYLYQKFTLLLGAISGAVQIGKSARTYDDWNKAGFAIKKGQKAVAIRVGENMRFYFFQSQVWDVAKYKKWQAIKKNIKKENNFSLEPSGSW